MLRSIAYAVWTITNILLITPVASTNTTINYTFYSAENANAIAIYNLANFTLNPDLTLKILCHGLAKNYSTEWYNKTIEEYMKMGEVNVIAAEYLHLLNESTSSTRKVASKVGKELGDFIVALNATKDVEFGKVHILGHLLGAHIAAVAGETVYQTTGFHVDRITGLDPTNTTFLHISSRGRLSKGDADFVDVVHASSQSHFDAAGDIDFFGSGFMTGCSSKWLDGKPLAPLFYANSINYLDAMQGTKCIQRKLLFSWRKCKRNETAVLGEHVDRGRNGKFFLDGEQISKYIC